MLDITEIVIWQFALFSFFVEQALSLKIKRRGQSFADRKCHKSVQINFSDEIQTLKHFKFFYVISVCKSCCGFAVNLSVLLVQCFELP